MINLLLLILCCNEPDTADRASLTQPNFNYKALDSHYCFTTGCQLCLKCRLSMLKIQPNDVTISSRGGGITI